MKQLKEVHIFRAGITTDSENQTEEYTREDLENIAENYNTSIHEAPVVWSHKADKAWTRPLSSSNQLANGWVKRLYVKEDNLYGDIDVDSETFNAIKEGSLKKRSAGFYSPESKHNPVKGSWYLRHLALLGSEPPAIKGLKDITIFSEAPLVYSYNEPDNTINNFMERDEAIAALNENAADWIALLLKDDGAGFGEVITEMIPQPAEDNNWLWNEEAQAYEGQIKTDKEDLFDFKISKEGDGSWTSSVSLAKAETEAEEPVEETETVAEEFGEDCNCSTEDDELKELREFKEKASMELEKLQKIVAEKMEEEKKAKYSEVSDFCASLYSEGRLSEASIPKKSLTSLMISLLGDTQPLTYSEGDKEVSVFDTLSTLLKSIPSKVEFSEATTREINTPVVSAPIPKYLGKVSPESEKEYAEIRRYMDKNGISDFREARRACMFNK